MKKVIDAAIEAGLSPKQLVKVAEECADKMTKFYRFDFDKGVPVQGGNMRWRRGLKTIAAYCAQDAVEKFAMPVFRQYGTKAKLNVVKAFVSDDKKNWREISLTEVHFAAFIVGCLEREKLHGATLAEEHGT